MNNFNLGNLGLAPCLLLILGIMAGDLKGQDSAQMMAQETYFRFDVSSGMLEVIFYNVGMPTKDEGQLRDGAARLKQMMKQNQWATKNFDLPAFEGVSERATREKGYIKIHCKLKTEFTEPSALTQIWEGLFRTKSQFKEGFKVGDKTGGALFFENPSLKITGSYAKAYQSGPTSMVHWTKGRGVVFELVVNNLDFDKGTALEPYY